MTNKESILKYLDDSIICIESLKKNTDTIQKIIGILEKTREDGRRLFLMGNGGSASLASHLICDLGKFRGLKATALTDSVSIITAYGNDVSYDVIFENQIRLLAEKGDVVIGISGSGNSENIIRGIRTAKEIGCTTIGFTAFGGGKLKEVVDECIIITTNNMQHAEDLHTLIGHMIAFLMEDKHEN